MFRTWPDEVVKKVAEESRLRDYNSDEVIVRDSCKLHWIIFITKVKSWDCELDDIWRWWCRLNSFRTGISKQWNLKWLPYR